MLNRSEPRIKRVTAGDRQATHALFRAVYDDLRRIAASNLAGEAPGQTLTATALVHEAFLKLGPQAQWNDGAHLYRTAAKAMRQILIDAARRKQTQKHGGELGRRVLNADELVAVCAAIEPAELHEAIEQLEAMNPSAAEVFELRYYAGLTWEQIAETLGMSVEKSEGLWAYARAKLALHLSEPS